MTDEKLKKTIELNKKIAYTNDKVKTLENFLCTMQVVDIRLTTENNKCLQYILDRKEVDAIFSYLITENVNKKFTLMEKYNKL